MAAKLATCKQAIITFRHGARLDCETKDEDEIEECGGLSNKFDTPLCLKGHDQALKTGRMLKYMLNEIDRPIVL